MNIRLNLNSPAYAALEDINYSWNAPDFSSNTNTYHVILRFSFCCAKHFLTQNKIKGDDWNDEDDWIWIWVVITIINNNLKQMNDDD